MYKYQLRITQTKFFDEEDDCFSSLVDVMDKLQKEGFVLISINENKYVLKKGDIKGIIEVIKEVNLI